MDGFRAVSVEDDDVAVPERIRLDEVVGPSREGDRARRGGCGCQTVGSTAANPSPVTWRSWLCRVPGEFHRRSRVAS